MKKQKKLTEVLCCRVDENDYDKFIAWCEKKDKAPSEVLREFVEKVVRYSRR